MNVYMNQGSNGVPPVPHGLDPWLIQFIADTQRETDILRENGADAQAAARDSVVRKLLIRADQWLNEEIQVSEAAELLDRCEETVRRQIRDGRLPDLRNNPRGHHRTRRGDVLMLAGRNARRYNPIADAQDIAMLRRSA